MQQKRVHESAPLLKPTATNNWTKSANDEVSQDQYHVKSFEHDTPARIHNKYVSYSSNYKGMEVPLYLGGILII